MTHHSGDFVHALQEFNNLGLVCRFHAGEETSPGASRALLGYRQVVELATRIRLVSGVLIFGEHANTSENNNPSEIFLKS